MMEKQNSFQRVSFLGLKMDKVDMDQTLIWMENAIAKRRPQYISTLNAALLVWAQRDSFLKETYLKANLVTVDSTVVYYALKLLGTPIPEPLEACHIMFQFIKRNYKKGYRFYFLGAKPEIIKKAVEKLQTDYIGIQIAGYHHGYFNPDTALEIAKEIKRIRPDCLFVGMSSPLKEVFLKKHLLDMQVPISLGVGGGIDILAGQYRWAPAWIRRLGLAWVYRLLSEPRRMWKRYLITNTIFLWLFFKSWTRKILP